MAPRLTKITPKCGIEISITAATTATVTQIAAQVSKKSTGSVGRLYAEERPACCHPGPRNARQHQEQRQSKADEKTRALRGRRCGLARENPSEVRKDHG